MYVTEVQAAQLLCCENTVYKCHGSGCMAWRWATAPSDPQPFTALGFCGLALQPPYAPPKVNDLP